MLNLKAIKILTLYGFVCISVSDFDPTDPYLKKSLLQILEKAVITLGMKPSCEREAKEVSVKVKELRDVPISISPLQRVTSYNLILSVELSFGDNKETITSSVPYSLPYGGVGDLPRRQALEDLLDKIYPQIQNFIRRLKDADKP